MAIARRFKINHDEVFPFGAYLVAEVGPVFDFEKLSKDAKVQQIDKDNGLPLWSVEVLDADPEAGKKSKTVTVKIAARVQPVPPEALPGCRFARWCSKGSRRCRTSMMRASSPGSCGRSRPRR
jgi:hypothetical protein